MLKENDIRIDVGRASHGGDFTRMIHVPTGIERVHPGPLKGVNRRELERGWLSEIESELKARGLVQYILPNPSANSSRKNKSSA